MHPLTLISEQLDGEISPGESRFLTEHLAACADCRRKAAGMLVVAAGLRELPVPEPPAGAVDRLLVLLRDSEVREVIPSVAASPQAAAAEESVNELSPPPPPRASREPRAPHARRARFHYALAIAAVVAIAVPAWILSAKTGPLSEPAPEHEVLPHPAAAEPQAPAVPSEPLVAGVPRPMPELAAPWREERPAARIALPSAPPLATELPPPPAPPAPIAAPPDETRHEPARVPVDLPPLSFEGDAKRLPRESRERVEDLARLLLAHPEMHLAIRGYTDERRSIEKTLALGQKRAEKIVRQLQELGVDESRLRVESLPIDRVANRDVDGRKRESEDRVEFVLEPRSGRAER